MSPPLAPRLSAARRQIIGGGGGAPINKSRRRRRPQIVGGGGAARPAHGSTFNRRVVGSTSALAATYRDLGQVLYLQLPMRLGGKLRSSIRAVVGSGTEEWET